MMLSEFKIIETLKTAYPEHIGDDAAILDYTEHEKLAITKDLLIEDTHFRLDSQDAKTLAHKALHVNLSDLAAMGATPKFVLLGLALPEYFKSKLPDFLEAFTKACQNATVLLIGGDTTRSNHGLQISVTALGIVNAKHVKYRTTAKPNDLLCHVGYIGDAHLGLSALEQKIAGLHEYKNKFLAPDALVHEGVWLAKHHAVTSMMDCSDGLYIDAKRLAKASRIALELHLDNLKPPSAFIRACHTLKLEPMDALLAGGEDYGLLLTVKEEAYATLSKAFEDKFSKPLKCIGKCHSGDGLRLIEHGLPVDYQVKPFLHFGELLF